jgi:hypothetical protein
MKSKDEKPKLRTIAILSPSCMFPILLSGKDVKLIRNRRSDVTKNGSIAPIAANFNPSPSKLLQCVLKKYFP